MESLREMVRWDMEGGDWGMERENKEIECWIRKEDLFL